MEQSNTLIRAVTALMLLCCAGAVTASSIEPVNQAVRLKDFNRAFSLCLPLAQGDNSEAQYKLATFYRNGTGVVRNDQQAFHWYQLSARNGYVKAQYQLGQMYQQGIGVGQDLHRAREWYSKAASGNYRKAALALKQLQQKSGSDNGRDMSSNDQMLHAVSRGQVTNVIRLLERGANINTVDRHGNGLLHIAIQHNDGNMVKMLISRKINLDARNNDHVTPLMLAAGKGQLSVTRQLVRHGAYVNYRNADGQTAYSRALQNQYVRLAEYLRSSGATGGASKKPRKAISKKQRLARQQALISQGPYRGWTPLMVAAWTGDQVSFAEQLRQQQDLDEVDRDGYTALMRAAWKGRLAMLGKLLDRGASVDLLSGQQQSALMLAAGSGQNAVVCYLLGKGADDAVKDLTGQTALMLAARNGHAKAVDRFARHNTAIINSRRNDGLNALMMAAGRGHTDVISVLLRSGANPLLQDRRKQNALWHAMLAGHVQTSVKLLPGIRDINERNIDGSTLLTEMSSRGDLDSIRLLLDAGADINQTTSSGNTVLMLVAHAGHVNLVRYYLRQGVEVNQGNRYGKTALMQAAQMGRMQVVKLLMQYDANVSIRNRDKQTAADLARHAGYRGIAKMLDDRDAGGWLGIF